MSDVNLNKYSCIFFIFLLAGTTTGFFLLPLPVSDLLIHPCLCLLVHGLILFYLFLHFFILIFFIDISILVFSDAVVPLMGKFCLNLAISFIRGSLLRIDSSSVAFSQV